MTTARRIAALLALVGAMPLLAGCVLLPDALDPPAPCSAFAACSQIQEVVVESATFSQSQAVPDFDSGTYLVTDPAALDDLEALVQRIRTDTVLVEGCPGGRTTELVMTTTQYDDIAITVDTCSDDPLAGQIDELVAGWHASGVATSAP